MEDYIEGSLMLQYNKRWHFQTLNGNFMNVMTTSWIATSFFKVCKYKFIRTFASDNISQTHCLGAFFSVLEHV